MMSNPEPESPRATSKTLETAALRKLIYQLAASPDPDDVDIFEAAELAVNRVESLEQENEELRERLGALEGATGINLENAEYKQLSRAAKLKRIREKLAEKAEQNGSGKAAMDYNDIMWLFDGHASPGHASTLLKEAGEAEGYSYKKHEDRNNRVTVDVKKGP